MSAWKLKVHDLDAPPRRLMEERLEALLRERGEPSLVTIERAAEPETDARFTKEQVVEALEGLVKRQELNSRDAGWVVSVGSIEAFCEFFGEDERGGS